MPQLATWELAPGQTESRPFEISYETLRSAAVLNVSDEDSSWVSLVVTATSNGIFKKGSIQPGNLHRHAFCSSKHRRDWSE